MANSGIRTTYSTDLNGQGLRIGIAVARFNQPVGEGLLAACTAELAKLGVREDDLKTIDNEIKKIVVEAADFAEQAPEPDPAELYTDILVESY